MIKAKQAGKHFDPDGVIVHESMMNGQKNWPWCPDE